MEDAQNERSLFERLFDHEHFRSLSDWRLDVLICFIFSAVVTPADPFSIFFVAAPLIAIWMPARYLIARRLAQIAREKPVVQTPVTIRLSKHEALALMSFLMRFRDEDELSLKSDADEQILYDLCALVQNELRPELTSERWNELLAEAQDAVIAGEE